MDFFLFCLSTNSDIGIYFVIKIDDIQSFKIIRYMCSVRVSTEDQSRFGFSLDEQEESLKRLCEWKGYKIYKVYREEGVSAKSMNRPKFQEMIQDMKDGKINKILVYKLDRLTRSIQDLETICKLLEEYKCDLESECEEINTSTPTGVFFMRMTTILAQLEIERTSERTKFGLMGAAKKGHFSGKAPIGYRKINKELVIDEVESEVVKDIFKSYLSGLSVCTITKRLNEKNALNHNWRTTTIDRMLSNYIYAGNYQHRKRIQNEETILLEDVCPAIIDKHDFELVQKQKEKNLKNYTRKHTYVYMQKIVCSKCNKIMGGSSTTSKNKPTQIYYKCNCCNTRINEKKIEQPLMLFLNDMLDYYLLIDNNYKSFFNEDLTIEIKRYEKILKDLNTKLQRIKNAYLNSNIEQDDFIEEEKSIKMQIEETKIKLNSLNNADENLNHKEDLKLYNNLFQLEKMKYKSYYVRKNGLWNKLTKEQKAELITKYIDSIEIEKMKDEIIIKKININKKEIQNIGYMFRNDCFDMAVNINERDVILSNEKTKEDITRYIESLSKFYKIAPITIEKDKLDIDSLSNNSLLQIIPNKKENKFEKDRYTLLQISA